MRRLLLVIAPLACNAPAMTATSDEPGSDTSTTASTTDASTEATEPTTGAGAEDDALAPVDFECQPGPTPSDPFIDCVESFHPVGASFGHDQMPQIVQGPPVAGPGGAGSVDVVSLGCDGEITLYFDEPAIVDGPGPDFIVFENPLPTGMSTFVEPARVLVSADGRDWHEFPCPTDQHPPLGCAGVAQVLAGPDNTLDPTDPAEAGGDAFDLAELGLARARYVRLRDVGVAYYGARTWCGGAGGGFDLDAIAVVH